MKKLTTLTLGFMFVTLLSCSNEGEKVTMNENQSLSTKSLRDRNGILFSYTTQQEATDMLTAAVETLVEDGRDEIIAGGFTDVVSVINVADGKGLLSEVYFCDVPRNLIVDRFVLNPVTGELDSQGGGEPIMEENMFFPYPLVAYLATLTCPFGYTEIANCTDPGSLGQCMTIGIATFNSQNSGNASYIVNNNLTGVAICAEGL